MRKLIIYIFVSISIFGSNLDSGIFLLKDFDMFFYSNSKNILEIDDKELEKYQNVLAEYQDFYGLNIKEILPGNEYMISFYERRGRKNFVLTSVISKENYRKTSFYNNNNFEKDLLNGINTYYLIGEDQFVYFFLDDTIFVSNDIANFFDTTDNITEPQHETLSSIESFDRLFEAAKDEEYLFYKKYDVPVSINGKEIKHIAKSPKNIYYDLDDDISEEESDKYFDLSNMIVKNYDEIYIGREYDRFTNEIKNDFRFFNENITNIFESYFNDNLELIFVVGNENNNYYVVAVEDIDDFRNFFLATYEKQFFYNRDLKVENKNGVLKFTLPLINIENYFIIQDGYFIFSKDYEILLKLLETNHSDLALSEVPIGLTMNYDKDEGIFEHEIIQNGILVRGR